MQKSKAVNPNGKTFEAAFGVEYKDLFVEKVATEIIP